MQRQNDVNEFECIQMWNLTPQDYKEAVTLIPSLANYNEQAVTDVIDLINSKLK